MRKHPQALSPYLPVVTGVLLPQPGPSAVCHTLASIHSYYGWYFACRLRCYGAFAIGRSVERISSCPGPPCPLALDIPAVEETAGVHYVLSSVTAGLVFCHLLPELPDWVCREEQSPWKRREEATESADVISSRRQQFNCRFRKDRAGRGFVLFSIN